MTTLKKEVKSVILKFLKVIEKFVSNIRSREINKDEINQIIIASLYFRGDTLFHTPVFRLLKNLFPNSKIDVWIKSRSEEIIRGNVNIDKVIVFDDIKTSDYNENVKLSLRKKIRFGMRIRKQKYDLYIDLTGKYSTALMGLIFNSKYSFGINYNGFGFCYNNFINLDTSTSPGHLIAKYLNVLKIGLNISDLKWKKLLNSSGDKPEIFIDNDTRKRVEKELEKRLDPLNPLITIHTGAGWAAKEWDEENFSRLIEKILNELRYNILIVGDVSESERVNHILNHIERVQKTALNNLFLPLSLKGTAEIIRRSDVFIGSDSVPLHIAGAMDTPSVALFGPTNPSFSNPKGEKHIVIYHRLFCSAPDNHQFCSRDAGKSCPTIDCMKGIKVDEVIDKIEMLINKYYKVIVKEDHANNEAH